MHRTKTSADRSLFNRTGGALTAGAAALLLAGLAAPARADSTEYGASASDPAGYDTAYSYVRVLDGSATLIQGAGLDRGAGERSQAEVNQPVLAGDRLWVAPRSRVEVVLSDRNLLRLDGETELAFEQLAFSPENGDRVTTLRLLRGNAQLVVSAESLGDELPRLDTLNATVFPQDFGLYRVTSDGGDWTEVVVRRGRAEVVSGSRAVTVLAGDKALLEGRDGSWADVRKAAGHDGLERWADDLDRRARGRDVPYVHEDLRYAAAPLEDHGRWVEVSGSYAWRPRVETGWRPYWHGRWAYTPAGVTWISSEPWGWVPYHYGTWDYAPGFGWVWFPGHRFSPAWVYWHWGSGHVAWVPVGYYTRHYRHHYPGFRSGVYGWAGGSSGFFADWVFCDRTYFGRRHHGSHFYRGHDWSRRHGGKAVPRGILTTDTRPLRPSLWNDPEGSMRVLRTRPGAGGRSAAIADLPDVTPFVARRGGDLPGDVARRVAITRGEVDRVAGSPLAPGTHAPEARLARPRTGLRAGTSDGAETTTRTVVTTPETGVRSARPGTGIRGEAAGPDRDGTGRQQDPRSRAGRPVAVERSDSPRASAPRTESPPAAERPAAERPAAGRPGTAVRRSPEAASPDEGKDSSSGGQAVRPRSTVGATPGSASPGRGLTGSAAPERGREGDRGGVAARAPRPAAPVGSARGGDAPAATRSAPAPRAPAAERSAPRAAPPATVRPRTVEPPGDQRRGSARSGDPPGSPPSDATVRRSAPPTSSSPRAARPESPGEGRAASSAPVTRAPAAGLRAPAPRSSPSARSQPSPSRPPQARSAPVARSQPAPDRAPRQSAPEARSQPAPRRAPAAGASPQSGQTVRTQPSRPAPRSTPSAGSSSGGGSQPSAPQAGSGSSQSGGGAKATRGGGTGKRERERG